MSTVWYILSMVGGYHDARGGYHEYRGVVQYRGGNLLLFEYPHGTHDIPSTCIMKSPTVLNTSRY